MGIFSCGYRIIGKPSIPQTSGQIFSIGVVPFMNHTTIPGLELIVTDAVMDELSTWPGVKIKKPGEAEYTISGEILQYQSQIPHIYIDANQYPLEYQLSMTVNFCFNKKGDDTPIEIKEVTIREPYKILYQGTLHNVDITGSKYEEYKALSGAIGRAVQSVMDRMFVMESHDAL